jgi:hypothetical protein
MLTVKLTNKKGMWSRLTSGVVVGAVETGRANDQNSDTCDTSDTCVTIYTCATCAACDTYALVTPVTPMTPVTRVTFVTPVTHEDGKRTEPRLLLVGNVNGSSVDAGRASWCPAPPEEGIRASPFCSS